MSIKALQDYTFYARYAKYVPEKKRRENWKETISRVFDMHRTQYEEQIKNSPELAEYIDYAQRMVEKKMVLGSQRAMQFGGPAILDKNERIYNCASGHIDRVRAFQEAHYLLLCGTGVGFSCQKKHISRLPNIAKPTKGKKTYQIPDSIEGWADSIGVLLSSYFIKDQPFPEYFDYEVEFDYSLIRPKGTFISWGGLAPGPDGLKNAHEKIFKLISMRLEQEKNRLRPIDCYDILMHVSDSVLSGGIRRSACSCLFSPDDEEMLNAKIGDWFLTNPQRARSNNSALLIKDKTPRQEFNALFKSTKEFGEPGFVWTDHEDVCFNPCFEIGMWPIWTDDKGKTYSGWQFCNLTEINGKKATSKESFLETCKAAAIIGTLQAGYDTFPYMGDITENITRKEALLGCSITGMMDNPDILFNIEIQREGAKLIKEWNRKIAQLININEAARTTAVKPAGHSSCILGTGSGIHPHHSKQYFRRVQSNKIEFPAQHFKKINPIAVEESAWSANNTDEVITFLCEVPPGAKLKNDMSALDLLEHVKLTQMNWIEYGTNKKLCTQPFVRHNVSNTITIKNEEWADVEKFIYDNRKHFAGISLLPFSGDKDYDQAPFCAVYTPSELVKMYGDASVFASGLIVDCEHVFDTLFKGCDTILGIGETLAVDRLREHIRNCKDSGVNGFYIDTHGYPKGPQIKLTPDSSDEDLKTYLYQNVNNWGEKLDWVRRGKQFAERYFNGDLRQMTYCLKDVSNWKKWCDLSREYKNVDWDSVVEEQHYIKVDEMGAQACAGGQCEINF